MNNTESPLSDYYKSIRLSPVEHDIAAANRMALHERKRRNLLELHLKLPMRFWRGAKVLEFGPASGENAVVLAKHGALLTFVEPVDYLLEKLKANFKTHQVTAQIEAIHNTTVERFKSNKQYDAVHAEGFVQFLDAPGDAIRKMASHVDKDGFLLVSVVHTAGTFIEFVKKVFLHALILRMGATSDRDRLDCAESLFLADFERINHSRGFESWAKDTVLNPLYRRKTFLEYEEALKALPDDFIPYSTWPNYLNHDDLVWHKTLREPSQLRNEAIDAYYARLPHFIHGIPGNQGELPPLAPTAGRRIARALNAALTQMDKTLDRPHLKLTIAIAALKKLQGILRAHRVEKAASIVGDSVTLLTQAGRAKTTQDFKTAYSKTKLLRKYWGCPGHYYVFHRPHRLSP